MHARLIVEEGGADPRKIELSPEKIVTLGRNRANTMLLRDAKASRFHAEVFFTDGAWHVRTCSTTNATRVDGERIQQATRLSKGQIIGIGAVRIRFESAPSEASPAEALLQEPDSDVPLVVTPVESVCEHLDQRGLTALFYFMNAALVETTPHGLITLALRTVREQTQASVCGFLSFDTEDSQLKVVLPAEAEVNVRLSLQLTLKVRAEGCTIWLKAPAQDNDGVESVTLAAYQDALCVPLRRNPTVDAGITGEFEAASGPLGALHAYRLTNHFTESEVRFCEALASCLANALHVLRSRRALEADNTRLREHAGRGGDELIGDSQPLRELRGDVASLALSPCTVLIEGESGVGKELVALALHRLSPRREGPLVTVNCAALSTNLADAELFGHEKGAFTGADKARPGLFQLADEGTLFLDEIGELTPEMQARLLRVLETKRFWPLGAKSEIKVDVRIIAATNRDLEKEMRAGRFRRDLFFRLGARLHIPPLRDHPEDIPALADHFLTKLNHEYRRQVSLSPEAIQRLKAHPWQGNVRQLRSVLETAVAMSPADILRPSCLRLKAEEEGAAGVPETLNLEQVEARVIREALGRTAGVLVHAAKLLGIHRETLINKMRKYGIRARADQAEEGAPGPAPN
jgi:two-component system response regulator HydG